MLLGVMVLGGGSIRSAEPPAAEKKPDWAALDALVTAGDYREAARVADEIAVTVKPKRRAPDFLPRSIELIRALTRRGLAQLRLVEFDAADDAFTEAYRAYKDSDFQRLLSLEARKAGAAVASQMVMLEVSGVDLVDMRSLVIPYRMRYANLTGRQVEEASAALASQPVDDVARWLGELKVLKRIAADGRESLAERFEKGGAAVLASPYSRAVAGKVRPAIIAGITSLELSRMPIEVLESDPVRDWLGPGSKVAADTAASEIRTALLQDALDQFKKATVALDEVVTAVSPTGAAGLRGDARIEAALMESELLVSRGTVMKETGDLARAREDFARAMELQREVAVLRKNPNPDAHPDLFWPLLLDVDATLEQARQWKASGENERSQSVLHEVSKTLARAASLPFLEKHPLRAFLASLSSRLQGQRAELEESLPRSDAADTAARRLRGAIDATAIPGIAP